MGNIGAQWVIVGSYSWLPQHLPKATPGEMPAGEGVSRMFQGEFKNAMDAKGRVNIPAAFRDTLRTRYGSEEIIVTRDYDNCLHAYAPKAWERDVLAGVQALPVTDAWRRGYERFVVSPAVTCVPDKQGRILLPPTLREFAGLDKAVLFAGGASHFEIWDVARHEAQLEKDLAMLRNGPPQT